MSDNPLCPNDQVSAARRDLAHQRMGWKSRGLGEAFMRQPLDHSGKESQIFFLPQC